MKVQEYSLERTSEHTLLSAVIGGHELWYRLPRSFEVERPGDVLATAALFPAMLADEPLEIDPGLPVSQRLMEGIETIQKVFSSWYPILHRIRVEARVARGEGPNPEDRRVASFYSGGVDGIYTMLNHEEEITHLVFAKGMDMQLDNDALFREALEKNEQTAKRYGKALVQVETNVRIFGTKFKQEKGGMWPFYHGCGMASVALAMDFRKVYFGSSHTYSELIPHGSHPLTDGLMSSESTEIIHDAAEVRRSDKLRRIAQDEQLLRDLRVCLQESGYNCGRCEKCLRTMIVLRLLGVSSSAFPPLKSAASLKRIRCANPSELTYFEDNLRLARAKGDRAVERALARCILRYHARQWLVDVDRILFSGGLKRRWIAARRRSAAS